MKPKIEVKILNEPVLKTYIVSPEKQKAFLKKAIVQKDKIIQLNKSDSIKEHVSQVKKVVKNKQATNLINKPKQKISNVMYRRNLKHSRVNNIFKFASQKMKTVFTV